MTSAYPKTIAELVPQAETIARELGRMPSQNRLKAALHVRAERAKAVLAVLNESGFDPSAPSVGNGNGDRPVSVPAKSEPQRATAPVKPAADSSAPVKAVAESVTSEIPKPHVADTVCGLVGAVAERDSDTAATEAEPGRHRVSRWPLVALAAPAFVAIWSGWVGVGELSGFGPVRPLPGIADGLTINSAITLPIGMETYAAYALRVWLSADAASRARRFAKQSAIAAFALGALGQIAYHLMTAARMNAAPWWITAVVSCLPVVVLGFGAALMHLQHVGTEDDR